jgi:hypothetical protein
MTIAEARKRATMSYFEVPADVRENPNEFRKHSLVHPCRAAILMTTCGQLSLFPVLASW